MDIIEETLATSHFVLSTPVGDAQVALPLPGRHNILNALAAAAVALALDVPLDMIVDGLEQAAGVPGRLLQQRARGGWRVIDDSYNANPSSMAAAIETLSLATGERWLVLGDMAELGADAARMHAAVGALAQERGIEHLFAVGPLGAGAVAAFGAGAEHFQDKSVLIAALRQRIHAGVTCLVKGSRSAAMEQVVTSLTDDAAGEVTDAA